MSTHSDCPLCPKNALLTTDIIAKTNGAYLISAVSNPGNFLIIPITHTESPLDLPDTWWADFKTLLAQVPHLPEHYNISLNYGKHAGQTVAHVHFWVIPRTANQPASGKGLARFISEANQR